MSQPRLHQISRSVHAWIGANGDSNAGAIRTPRGVVVIDTQQTLDLARQFQHALVAAVGLPISMVVNTHAHLDHLAGNSLFAGVPILAHKKAVAALERFFGQTSGANWHLDGFERTAKLLWGENLFDLIPQDDPQLDWFRQRISGPAYQGITITAPTDSFSDQYQVGLVTGCVSLQYHGPAHSEGDITVYIPEEKVIFLSDLMFHGRFPWMGDCDLNGWIDRLETILRLEVDVVVPGHGPVTDLNAVKRFRQLFVDLRDRVQACIRAGASEEAAMAEIALQEYAHLPRYDQWRAINIRAAYRALR